MYKYVLSISIILILIGCNENKRAYELINRDDRITVDIVKRVEQFFLTKSGIGLIINISNDWNSFDYHIYFFNDSLNLINACYLPSNGIDSIKMNTIYITGSDIRKKENQTFCSFGNSLEGYFLKKTKNRANKREKISNKLIQEIEVMNKDSVKLVYRKSNDLFCGLRRESKVTDYTKEDSITIPIYKLKIDYKNNSITVNNFTDRIIVSDIMYCSEDVLDKLFNAILQTDFNK